MTPAADGIAVVVGGASGLGLACATELGRERPLLVADLPGARLKQSVGALRAVGVDAIGVGCDISDPESVAKLGNAISARGEIAQIVHTAGIDPGRNGDGDAIVAVNLVGAALVLEMALDRVLPGGVGVFFGSIGAARPNLVGRYSDAVSDPLAADLWARIEAVGPLGPNPGAAYAVAKHGVIQMVERRAVDWGRRGARLVSLSPGMIAGTGMTAAAHPDGRSIHVDNSALDRAGEPGEIAAAVAFLCSPAASYISGCDLRVDGGATAGLHHHADKATRSTWDPTN